LRHGSVLRRVPRCGQAMTRQKPVYGAPKTSVPPKYVIRTGPFSFELTDEAKFRLYELASMSPADRAYTGRKLRDTAIQVSSPEPEERDPEKDLNEMAAEHEKNGRCLRTKRVQ
jgi:hypothetical protein